MSEAARLINQAGTPTPKSLLSVVLWCFIASLLINLFCNSFSPFFIPEGAMDPNCFYAEGCAISQGYLPYRDFIDVKGPLLFLIYTIGYLMSPTQCYGIFFIYVLATWGTLIAFYRTVKLISPCSCAIVPATVLVTCCLFSRFTAYWAAQPEQLLALPLAWVLYYLTAFLKHPKASFQQPLSCWLSIGCACTFLIKYNFILPYIAVFGLVVFIMARHLSKSDILVFCLRCIIYSALVCAPFIIYLSYHGLWGDFFYSYFLLNVEATSSQQVLSTFTFKTLMRKIAHPSVWLSYIVLGHAAVCVLTKYNACIDKALIKQLLPVFIATYLSCAMGAWGYYYILIAPIAVFLCADLCGHKVVANLFQSYKLLKAIAFALLFIFAINAHCISNMAWGRSAESAEKLAMVQDKIAHIPSPKMIYYDCPDFLLGRKAKSLPGTPAWMNLPNAPSQVYEQRKRDIDAGKADFIVTCEKVSKGVQDSFEKAGYKSIEEAKMKNVGPLYDVQVWATPYAHAAFLRP